MSQRTISTASSFAACAVSACLLAGGAFAQSVASREVPQHWQCAYVVERDLWAVQCFDPVAVAEYDPWTSGDRCIVWSVPLWSAPTSPDRVQQLVRATLCRGNPACDVSIADVSRSGMALRLGD